VESVTVTLTVKPPVEAVEPVMAPELEFMVSPVGSPVALQWSGVLPPEATTVALYAAPDTPFGRDEVLMLKARAMVKDSCFVTVCAVGVVPSVMVRVTVKPPPDCGVPEMIPVDELMLSPVGSPEALQLSGRFPPEADNVVLYASPTAPLGRDVLVIAGAVAMFNVSCLLAV
jgi:hypothetical protein